VQALPALFTGSAHTLQEAVLRGLRGIKSEESFWALDGVSFWVGKAR